VRYLFHGYLVDAARLTVKDKEGVSYDFNVDGAFYITTTIGREYYVPGDYKVETLDGSVRVREKDAFEPFAEEVEKNEASTADRSGGADRPDSGDGVSGSGGGDARDDHEGVRVDHGQAPSVGETDDTRGDGPAQRRHGHSVRDAGTANAGDRKARQNHASHTVRGKTRRRVDREPAEGV